MFYRRAKKLRVCVCVRACKIQTIDKSLYWKMYQLICDKLDGVVELPNDMSNLSRWLRGLRHGSATAGLQGLQVRILPAYEGLFLVSFMLYQVEVSATWFLPSVDCLSVIAEPQQWEGLGPLGLSSQESKNLPRKGKAGWSQVCQ